MKNQQQGIIWAPVLIIIGVVVVAGIATYMLIQAGSTDQTENGNVNVAVVNRVSNNANENINTNETTNTNQVTNINAGVNTNSTGNTNTASNTNTATGPTAGWKTYTNSEFEVTFKYPTDWSITSDAVTTPGGDSSNRVLDASIRSSDGDTMSLTVNPPGVGLRNPWKNFITTMASGKIIIVREEVVDRSDEYADTETYSIYVRDLPNTFIVFTYREAVESQEFDLLAKQILATFTFTN